MCSPFYIRDYELPKEFMSGVQLLGHGGYENLVYSGDIPRPTPSPQELLIKVHAAAINNTDINTRVGWYSKSATSDTAAIAQEEGAAGSDDDSSWGGNALTFPRIQGIDICGEVVGAGSVGNSKRIGERVLVSPCLLHPTEKNLSKAQFVGSECNGGFAQYVTVPDYSVFKISSDLKSSDLASFPCSYSTAENLLERAHLKAGERILITGASGGVGSAAIQLAKRRGAYVIAVASSMKHIEVIAAGADLALDRNDDLLQALGDSSVDMVLDIVGGPQWPTLLEIIKTGGRYATAGAIAGPMVELDLRTLYLKDLTLIGATVLAPNVFPNLISYIENKEIKPLVANIYPLHNIVQAQKDFLEKKHTGKLILIPNT